MNRQRIEQSTTGQLRMRRRVREIVCSEPWLEVCWAALMRVNEAGAKRPGAFLDHHGVYPPGGKRRTRMVHCNRCGKRWYPPHYVQGNLCLDCAAGSHIPFTDEQTHVSSSSSPSAIAFRQMEFYRVRLIESRLEAEDEATLLRQIAQYQSKEQKSPPAQKQSRNVNATALI